MPISNNASYIPTMNEFLAHWGQVDALLGTPLEIKLSDDTGLTKAEFMSLRQDIEGLAVAVFDVLNDREIARGDIDLKKPLMLAWLNEFNGMLDGYWAGTAFHNARPKVPGITEGRENFLAPMRDMLSLWGKLNSGTAPVGVTLPLVLSEGVTVSSWGSKLELLAQAYNTEQNAKQDVVLRRGNRERLKAKAYDAMKAYRVIMPARGKAFPVLVDSLPALTPPGGHTPDPVNASAVFEAPDKAHVVYEASTEAMLDRYELRANPGTSYDDADAVTVATHTAADALEFLTNFGLTQPGAQLAMKVYVVLTTGNEAGSASMTVQRPF